MAKTERSGHTTTDHDFIRQWVEERGGWPARVKGTGGKGDPGLIRVDFPGWSGEGSLERIEWEEWFQGFDANNLAFLHRDMSHGGDDLDRFNKLISRDNATDDGEGGSSGGRRGRSSVAASARSRSGGQKSSSTRSGSRSGGSSSRSSSSETGSTSSGKSGGRSTSSSRSQSSGGSSRTSTRARGAAAAEMAAEPSELRELLKHELGDLLSAERLFLQGTKAMAKEAQDATVKARLEQHVEETEGHAQRIRQAFEAIGERAKAVTCEAAKGLKEEHDSFKSDEKPSKFLLSAFDLGSGLRVEHYEIAAYRSTIALATALGERECARILKQNLDEEVAMASFLEKTSRTLLKQMAGGGSSRGTGASRSGGSSSKSGSTSKSGGAKTTRAASTRTARSGGSRSRG
jgi:ferritin-like metal-binding protein YciE